MLSTNMAENNESRIEFPNKDPNEWKVFYPFIDPFQIGEAKHPTIDDENVMTLVPWFHEFQMGSLHQQCDEFLSDKVLSLARAEKIDNNLRRLGYTGRLKLDESFWDEAIALKGVPIVNNINWEEERNMVQQMRRDTFKDIIKLLEFSCIYDLKKTKKEAEDVISSLLQWWHSMDSWGQKNMLSKTCSLFDDLPTIKILTSLFLPLSEEEETDEDDTYKYFVSNGKSQVLWETLEGDWEFGNELKGLSLEDINTSPVIPVLVKTFIGKQGLQARINVGD